MTTGTIQSAARMARSRVHDRRLYSVVNSSHSTPTGATPKYWNFATSSRTSRSSIRVWMALVKLHSEMASISQPKAGPPGTPRRVRATIAAQIERAVDASSAAAWTVDGQNT